PRRGGRRRRRVARRQRRWPRRRARGRVPRRPAPPARPGVTEPPVTAASRPPRGADTLRVQLLRVLALDGARPATVVLDRAPAAIGRRGAGAGAIVLDDTEVSRQHAVVE